MVFCLSIVCFEGRFWEAIECREERVFGFERGHELKKAKEE